jgi:hypothetical protein
MYDINQDVLAMSSVTTLCLIDACTTLYSWHMAELTSISSEAVAERHRQEFQYWFRNRVNILI